MVEARREGIAPEEFTTFRLPRWRYATHESAFGALNARKGFTAPASGALRNPLAGGAQAIGRAAGWGVLHAGDPQAAVDGALFDAGFDHGGEGVWAACAVAAMTAAALGGASTPELLRLASTLVPRDSSSFRSLELVIKRANSGDGPAAILSAVGFIPGGEDLHHAVRALAGVAAAIVLGHGDFARTICLAAGWGGSSDQVGAAAGAIAGARASEADLAPWLKPLGTDFPIGFGLQGIEPPDSIEAFADRLAEVSASATQPAPEAIPAAKPSPDLPSETSVQPVAEEETSPADLATVDPTAMPAPLPTTAAPTWRAEIPAVPPRSIARRLGGVRATVEYVSAPHPRGQKGVEVVLGFANPGDEELVVEPRLEAPGYRVGSHLTSFRLSPGARQSFPAVLVRDDPAATAPMLQVSGDSLTLPILEPQRWYVCGPFPNTEGEGFDRIFRAQDVQQLGEVFNGRSHMPVQWHEAELPGLEFDLERVFGDQPGTVFLWGRLRWPEVKPVKVVAASAVGIVLWADRQQIVRYQDTHRPAPRAILPYAGEFAAGEVTEVLVKVLRGRDPLPPVALYFLTATGDLVEPAAFEPMPG